MPLRFSRLAAALPFLALGASLAASACAPRNKSARPIGYERSEAPVAAGDCAEARRRAARKPDLFVDRLPTPVAARPAPFQNPPAGAIGKKGAKVKVDVLIDTLGRADMRTFKVVKSSHPWLAQNLREVMGKWTFSPAQLAGCKVPRVYHADINVGNRAR